MKKKVSLFTIMTLMLTLILSTPAMAAVEGQTQMTDFGSSDYNTDMWSIRSVNGAEVDASKVTIADGALNFVGAGDGCSFGPTGIYKNFTLRFDVLSVEEGSTFIGVCFGMDKPFDNFWDAGANMVYFQVATTDAFKDGAPLVGTDPAGVGTDNGGGRGWTRPGYEQWSVDGPNPEVLNYKLVVRDGAAEVYYKKASDPETELDVLRIRYNGFGDTTGFVKIASTAGANYKIDNFRIYNENPAVASFDSNQYDENQWKINSVPTEGLVSVSDNAVVFNGAGDGCYFGYKNTIKDFVLSFDVLSAEEGSTFIGACFGMDNMDDNFWVSGANMVYFQTANTDAFKDGAALLGSDPAGVGTDNGGGRGWTRPGYELWSGDGPNPEVLNYKLVVKNGTAEVYYKKASDPISELSVLRIRFAGFGDTTGFVKLVSTAGAFYTLDNIEIYPIMNTTGEIIANDNIEKIMDATTELSSNASQITVNSFKASWDKDEGASKYRVNLYSKAGEANYTFIKTVLLEDVQTTDFSDLSENSDYAFQVTSFDEFGFANNYYGLTDLKTGTADDSTNSEGENPETGEFNFSYIIVVLAGVVLVVFSKKRISI